MRNFKLMSMAFLSLVLVITSCKKEEDVEPADNNSTLKKGEVSLSRETEYGEDWVYYSFENNAEVEVSDHLTSLDWDLAFNRYNVRTNGGESGLGQAAVYDAGEIDFSSLAEAPEADYMQDDTIRIVKAFTGQGVEWMTSTGNDVFKGCVDLEYGNQGPVFTTNNHIYVVKTAKGYYAKLWVKSFYSDEGESGFINFKYHYQSAEGRELE
ncbi:MAG: hypothetical protein B7C24_00130 [Bacteroidetes bacterium 4572_77]|nr:MAG: hypothetical protein B7C24_00130 [Bacteroidetes bacterium 4572_77]